MKFILLFKNISTKCQHTTGLSQKNKTE